MENNIVNTEKIVAEMAETARKMVKGYEVLKDLKDVDIAETPKTLVYSEDKMRLFRYNRSTEPAVKTPVLIVYALVNTYKMMDLQPDRSYIKNLLDLGLDVYLIDWGHPTRADRYLTLDDYINGYINTSVDIIRRNHKIDKVNLMGICQGGTFSTIFSALHPEKVKNLVTLVTPVDFSTNDGLLFKWSKNMDFDAIVDANDGIVPGEFLNYGFEMLKPMMKLNKGQGLVNMLDDKAKLENYLRMEKWISESPAQAGECYRQFMKDMYQGNKLAKGELVINGKPVHLKNLTSPLMNIYATEDHLVPPTATIPLNDLVGSKDKEIYKFQGGHIGVFVGARSQKELAPAVKNWLAKRD